MPAPLRLPPVIAAALLSAATALLGLGPAVESAAGAAVTLTTTWFVLASARGTAAPAGWRWYALAVVVTGAGGVLTPLVTGSPVTALLGVIPGHLLTVAALVAMRGRNPWPTGRTQLATAAVLFVIATLIAVHVVLHPLATGPDSPRALIATVRTLPLVVSLTIAAALLLRGTVDPGRAHVAGLLLAAQSVTAGSLLLAVFAWGLASPALGAWVRPAMAVAAVLLCLACRLDLPRPATADPRLRTIGATVSLLPHLVVLVAGTLLLVRLSTASEVDRFDVGLGVVGLLAVLLHQVVMWRSQHRLTADLLRSENYFRTLVRGSTDPVVILDDRMRVTFASRALTDLLGRDAEDAVGRTLTDWLHPDDLDLLTAAACEGSTVRTGRVQHSDGRWRLIQATVRDLRQDPDVGAFVLYCRDVTPAQPTGGGAPALLELSLADPVTGLPNRAALVRRLAAPRAGGRPRALAVLGVTGFPDLPPERLRAVAVCLARGLRGEDWLARTKDGDFAVVASGTVADAEVLAARLVTAVASLDGADLQACAGVTALPDDVDPAEALRAGDVALRSARTGGPGCVRRADEALRLERDRRDALRADLAGALDRDELLLVFQPVVDVVLHRTVSVEALLRWRHPVFGNVSPPSSSRSPRRRR
ncbi:PAS domain S-box protein [Geodermatophilus sp. CPCC 205761]|uniref:PAS domain S-box protein n=1 Tax=Geodermatophilus sp. CPCC 205761 TaxID=2936597 RepID=UPI003EEED350